VAILPKSRKKPTSAEEPGQFQPASKGLGRIWTHYTPVSNNGQRNPQWRLLSTRVLKERERQKGRSWQLLKTTT